MPGEPVHHLRMLVGGVVVENEMNDLACRRLRLDGIEEADELLMPMALHAAADDGTFQDIQCGEQRGRAVALVVVGHRAGSTFPHRLADPRAVEHLTLALPAPREPNRMRRLVPVEANHLLPPVRTLRNV